MKILKLAFLAALSISIQASAQTEDRKTRVANYIEKYKLEAMREQRRTGVPASITLAQGVHETNAGASELATNANNHFGIKCKKEWTGETYTYTDDRPDECFRKYASDLESYKDHSDYLRSSPRYASLFALDITDYPGWANGLKRAGYATNPRYAPLLIKIVEENNLQQYTIAAMDKNFNEVAEAQKPIKMGSRGTAKEVVPDKDAPKPSIVEPTPAPNKKSKMIVSDGDNRYTVIKNSERPSYGQTVIVNGIKAFYAPKGSMLLNDAIKYHIRYAALLEYNDLKDEPLEADMFIYLDRKGSKGGTVYHVVKPGETMHQISQLEGLLLKNLRQYNKIKENEEPVSGSLLQLQETADQKPEVIVKKKEAKDELKAFSGSESLPVPQGSSRMKAGYLTKEEIEGNKGTTVTKKTVKDETSDETKTEVTITQPTEVSIDEEALTSPKNKVVKIEEETTTITPGKDVVVEKVTTTQSLENPDKPVMVEQETTTIHTDNAIVVEKNTAIVPVPSPSDTNPEETVNIADTKSVEENRAVTTKEAEEEEPKDEFARLKARLDKAVYASDYAKKQATDTKTEETKSTEIKKTDSPKVSASSGNKPEYYVVKKGDNAFGIAKKHSITMTQLKEWNNLDFGEIKVGQKLRVK
ncbi:MAG TPA: glucosaminidase domain-containing protein [Flavipsychrobacter sp.]|nr:glucosaminidase domain-containing protein [Flavipsychrobacter sp.]